MPGGLRNARTLMRQSDIIRRGGFIVTGAGHVGPGVSPPRGTPSYTVPMANQKIDSNSTDVDITNSTSETTIADVSAPALTVRNEGATRFLASGTILNKAIAGGTVIFKVKAADTLGTTTVLATSAVVCSTDTELRKWDIEAVMYGNATNVQTHWGSLNVSAASTATLSPSTFLGNGYSTSGLVETDIINVTMTAQLSGASTGFNITRESALFEAIV